MSIASNTQRVGRFTSSQASRLVAFGRGAKTLENTGAAFNTYVQEKVYEHFLGRSLDSDAYSQSTAWGDLMEQFVFDNYLGLDYELLSNKTTVHPSYDFWSGSADYKQADLVADIKGYWLKKYCEYWECLNLQDIEKLKADFSKEYWQLVSNSCIHGTKYAEVFLFAPTISQAKEVAELAEDFGTWEYRFVFEAIEAKQFYKLPLLPDESRYGKKNAMRFKFEVPESDKEFLTERVIMANNQKLKLINQTK